MRLEFRLQSVSSLTGSHAAVKCTFTFDSGVSGHLLVLLDRQDKTEPSIYDRAIVEISLKGVMRLSVAMATHETGGWNQSLRKPLLNMTTAFSLANAIVRNDTADECQFTLPVNFVLQHLTASRHHSACNNPMIAGMVPSSAGLPPSLCARTDLSSSGMSACDATVTYFLSARVLLNDCTLAYHFHEICIFPCHDPDPPACCSDFPGEYCLWKQQTLRTRLLRRWATLAVAAEEPHAFTIRPGQCRSLFRLALDLHLETRLPRSTNSPLCIEASITWTLEALTLLSSTANHTIPTLNQTRYTAGSGVIVHPLCTREVKTLWRKWVPRTRQANDSSVLQEKRWSAQEDVLLIMDDLNNLPPTFAVPFLSRRYRLRVKIRLDNPYALPPLEIKVPVQILYNCGQQPFHQDAGTHSNQSELPDVHALPVYTTRSS